MFVFCFSGGELYSGTTADFSGSDALIYRDKIRTEQNDLRHLNGEYHIFHYLSNRLNDAIIITRDNVPILGAGGAGALIHRDFLAPSSPLFNCNDSENFPLKEML